MRKLTRYQNGTLEEIKTAAGTCWYIRFTDENGKRPRHRIGLKSQFPTEAKASRAAQYLRDRFNDPQQIGTCTARTFGDVVARYENEEMPERYSTRRGYTQIHRNHLVPRWGSVSLDQMDPMAVRNWLKELDKSPKTKGNILGQMRSLCRFAMLWGWMPAAVNPMSLFTIPGVTKRMRKPRVINPAQWRELVQAAPDIRIRTMLIGAYCLGLRVSELFGLQWGDFDFLDGRVWIRRAIVETNEGNVKTERSNAPLPLAKPVLDAFLALYGSTALKGDQEWVFASPYKGGRLPLDSRNLQTKYLVPMGKGIGLDFSLGWHTFRHSYKVLLERAGADITVQRDLMRHADTHTTTQIYGEVEFDRMRASNDKAVELAFG
jgi:integrase